MREISNINQKLYASLQELLVDELQSSRTVSFMVPKLQVTSPHPDFILHLADLELTANGVHLRATELSMGIILHSFV